MRRSNALLGCALAAALCAGAVPVRAADAPALRVGATGNDAAAEAYYADALGLFKKRGLTVRILPQQNGAAEAAAVAGGSLDLGEQNVISMVHAHARGLPFVFIAPAAEYVDATPSTAMIVAKSSPLKTAKDLEGKTVAVSSLNDLTEMAAQAWIDANGGDSSKVQFIEMAPPSAAVAVAEGRVAAAVLPEPALSLASAKTRLFAKPFGTFGPHFMINGWFASRDWVAKNPAAAKAFADAIYEAGRWANAHHAESAKILEAHSRYKPEVIAHMTRATYATAFEPKTMQQAIDVAARYKAVPKPFAATEIYDASL